MLLSRRASLGPLAAVPPPQRHLDAPFVSAPRHADNHKDDGPADAPDNAANQGRRASSPRNPRWAGDWVRAMAAGAHRPLGRRRRRRPVPECADVQQVCHCLRGAGAGSFQSPQWGDRTPHTREGCSGMSRGGAPQAGAACHCRGDMSDLLVFQVVDRGRITHTQPAASPMTTPTCVFERGHPSWCVPSILASPWSGTLVGVTDTKSSSFDTHLQHQGAQA